MVSNSSKRMKQLIDLKMQFKKKNQNANVKLLFNKKGKENMHTTFILLIQKLRKKCLKMYQ